MKNTDFIKVIKKIKSKNLYYIERKIFMLLKTEKMILNTDLIESIFDFLDFQEEKLDKECKYKKLQTLLTENLC